MFLPPDLTAPIALSSSDQVIAPSTPVSPTMNIDPLDRSLSSPPPCDFDFDDVMFIPTPVSGGSRVSSYISNILK